MRFLYLHKEVDNLKAKELGPGVLVLHPSNSAILAQTNTMREARLVKNEISKLVKKLEAQG